MAEPFLKECDPIDDNGHLTSCFIENLPLPEVKRRTDRDIGIEQFTLARQKALEKIKLLFDMIQEEL